VLGTGVRNCAREVVHHLKPRRTSMTRIIVETPLGTFESKGTEEYSVEEMKEKIEEFAGILNYFTINTENGPVVLMKNVIQNSIIKIMG